MKSLATPATFLVSPARAGAQLLVALAPLFAFGQGTTFTTKSLTPEAALKAAQAALAQCRADGFQVTVAVVDRSGITQVVLRDRFAGAHTPDFAVNKAWTAVSFRTNTTELERSTRAGQPMAGIRNIPRFASVGGGLTIEGGGALVGGIGVSGAPGGDADEACAKAGIRAISDDLELG